VCGVCMCVCVVCVVRCVCVLCVCVVCVCVCVVCVVCVSVCMTGYVSADDVVIIRLWKHLILFHVESCYSVRTFRPQLTVCLFYLLTNTVWVSCIDNV